MVLEESVRCQVKSNSIDTIEGLIDDVEEMFVRRLALLYLCPQS